MLIRNRSARVVVWLTFGAIVLVLIVAPIAVTALTAFSSSWNSVLPSGMTTAHVRESLSADDLQSISVSVQTALVASACAVAVGTWAALAARTAPRRLRVLLDTAYHLPVAVPSVVVGLAVLIAFSKPPLILNGTPWIVIGVQALLVLSFAYSMVSAAAKGLDPALDRVADSLGASPWRTLVTETLPLLAPAIAAAAGLSVALCMGELGATIMVYPASWRTLPVTVFTQSDRGDLFSAAANTLLLVLVSVAILGLLSRVRSKAQVR
ncbi:ABC transporter permease subunit [Gordonia neofelifaecis]|uniref:Binding-protein-dependent transport systems inner membrane component n=1 Tax=Gordonia neofelifaecis NRRL B-59395 TaxID=644548 RepID=F1YG38_9ACTN|nr:ABC transporter permease subunit [Gordonia neofelifaecis]EGD56161.1 binding-protein-dependent transport systems inner membrane component [Gordonia neofelifaecis NRRL B-59395]